MFKYNGIRKSILIYIVYKILEHHQSTNRTRNIFKHKSNPSFQSL